MIDDISAAASAMGKKGGRSRSKAKTDAAKQNIRKANASLSEEARRERARKAAAARWGNRPAK